LTSPRGRGHGHSVHRHLGWGLVVLFAGCGRSDLSADLSGGGPDVPGTGTGATSGASAMSGTGATSGSGTGATSGDDASPGDDGASTQDATMGVGGDASTSDAGDAGAGPAGYFPDGSCGFATCPSGCCTPDGFCVHDHTTSVFCGLGGRQCFSCAPNICLESVSAGYPGTVDSVGVCIRPQTSCGASNCNGCCIDTPGDPLGRVSCVLRGSVDSCGFGGGPCTACQPNEHCLSTSTGASHCQVNDPCGPGNCAGCCAGDICAAGDQDIACGYAGVPCQSCSDGGGCVASICQGIDLL
jgi:hypothetical protein